MIYFLGFHCKITAGGRPGPDVFQEFHEEIVGILGHSKVDGSSADQGRSAHPKPAINGVIKRNPAKDIKRETSVESFNIFTEEEVSEPDKNTANNVALLAPVIVHKDVENILSIVTAGSLLDRVASGRINN